MSCSEIFSHPGVPLQIHLERVGETAYKFAKESKLNLPFPQEVLADVARLLGLYHDIGKATPFFQEYLQETDPERRAFLKNQKETRHSFISAIATYFAVHIHLARSRIPVDWQEFLPIAAFVAVKRHHGDLEPFQDEIPNDTILRSDDVLAKQISHLPTGYFSFIPYWDEVWSDLKALPDSWTLNKLKFLRWHRKSKNFGSLPYLLQNFLFSLLIDADKHITALGQILPRPHVPSDLIDRYRTLRGFEHPTTPMNQLRNTIYSEAIANLANLRRAKILSLTAPTGSGKTLTAISLALKLRREIENEIGYSPRIVYALPFLSIIDQNADVLQDVFKKVQGASPTNDLLLVHHHLADITYTTEEAEYEPKEGELLVEGWDSEIVITTFVQFFHTLFSGKNRSLRKFHRIAGSIVILDEIQSFPHKYWLLFKDTAEALSRYFNTVFILSTATQPAIFENPREILSNKEAYFQKLDRTRLRVRIQSPQTLLQLKEDILEKLREESKDTLIVLNTIRSAKELYNILRPSLHELGLKTFFLSSHVIPKERLQRIEEIKNTKTPKVVVSTQLVEAGVDLDFQWVIRDLAPMDAINQVAGRANRNASRGKGIVDLVLLVDGKGREFHSYIYDGLLILLTKEVIGEAKEIPELDFLRLISDYFNKARARLADSESLKLLQALQRLDYESIKAFRLIDEPYGVKIDIFIEVDEEARSVWKRFCAVQDIRDRWERRTAFKTLRGEFHRYVISVQAQKVLQNPPPEVKGIRYIPHEQLNLWYDPETGFKMEKDDGPWIF